MLLGRPDLRQKYPSYPLNRRGAVYAKARGDAALAACLLYYETRDYHRAVEASPARRLAVLVPPRLHLPSVTRAATAETPDAGFAASPPRGETKDAKDDAAMPRRKVDAAAVTARLHPPAPVPRPPAAVRHSSAAADEKFARRFHDGGVAKEATTAAGLNRKFLAPTPAAAVDAAAVARIVHRLADDGVAHQAAHRAALAQRWLPPTYRPHSARPAPRKPNAGR